MTKKILALVVAVMMVMALSVVAFADTELVTDPVTKTTTDQFNEGPTIPLDVPAGTTVHLTITGNADIAVRFYLSNASAGAVSDVQYIDGEGGDFTWEGDVTANEDAVSVLFKGQNSGGTITVTSVVVAGEDAAEPEATEPEATEPEATEPEATEPEAAPETNDAPAAAPEAPATGIALAVVPAIVAMAAVAVSKKR